ncbi:MAG: hypothetical protein ABFS23_03935, partial [Pseudomonadota bacterium]
PISLGKLLGRKLSELPKKTNLSRLLLGKLLGRKLSELPKKIYLSRLPRRLPRVYRTCPIAKVYEVDPLVCPRCGGEMRFLAVIEEAPVRHIPLDHGPEMGEGPAWP